MVITTGPKFPDGFRAWRGNAVHVARPAPSGVELVSLLAHDSSRIVGGPGAPGYSGDGASKLPPAAPQSPALPGPIDAFIF